MWILMTPCAPEWLAQGGCGCRVRAEAGVGLATCGVWVLSDQGHTVLYSVILLHSSVHGARYGMLSPRGTHGSRPCHSATLPGLTGPSHVVPSPLVFLTQQARPCRRASQEHIPDNAMAAICLARSESRGSMHAGSQGGSCAHSQVGKDWARANACC
jgi:hypothetical protein